MISLKDSNYVKQLRESHGCVLRDGKQVGVTCVQWRQVGYVEEPTYLGNIFLWLIDFHGMVVNDILY